RLNAAGFDADTLDKIKTYIGLTAGVDQAPGAPPPSLEQQAEQRFAPPAKVLWDSLNMIQPGVQRPMLASVKAALDVARNTAPLEAKGEGPVTVAKAAAPGQPGHDIEERP